MRSTNLTTDPIPQREQSFAVLETRSWYKKSSDEIKRLLHNLPPDFDGALADIAKKPDELEDIDIVRLIDLKYGAYVAMPIFEVRSLQTNQLFSMEYVVYKYGTEISYRGVVFIEINGEIQYVVLRKAVKFSLNHPIFESIGSFVHNPFIHKPGEEPSKIERQFTKILGLDQLIIKQMYELGNTYPDAGLTSLHPALYAIVVEGESNDRLTKLLDRRRLTTNTPLGFDIAIFPIKEINRLLIEIDDSFFHTIMLRLIAMGIIKTHTQSLTI